MAQEPIDQLLSRVANSDDMQAILNHPDLHANNPHVVGAMDRLASMVADNTSGKGDGVMTAAEHAAYQAATGETVSGDPVTSLNNAAATTTGLSPSEQAAVDSLREMRGMQVQASQQNSYPKQPGLIKGLGEMAISSSAKAIEHIHSKTMEIMKLLHSGPDTK